MRVFRDAEEFEPGKHAMTLAMGALGGFAIGLALSGRRPAARMPAHRELGTQLRERARGVARRLGPGRIWRSASEQMELSALTALEDAVLDVLRVDPLLRRSAIDVGGISRGIVELSGSVDTAEEAEQAVRLANRVAAVHTVLNRLAVRRGGRARAAAGLGVEEAEVELGGDGWTGRRVGMGRRRQGLQTDPAQADDSRRQWDKALRDADREQWVDEGLAAATPKMGGLSDVQSGNRTNFRESELDNQDPHGQHAARTLDAPPQALNSEARVGEGLNPGVERALENAKLSVEPGGGERGSV